MEWEPASTVSKQSWSRPTQISRLRARQVQILSQLDEYQVFLSDGDRGMEDWTASRLDVSPQTAHRLMTIAHAPDPWFGQQLAAGRLGLDRAAFLVKLAATGASAELIAEAADNYSLGRLWGLVEARREVTATHRGVPGQSGPAPPTPRHRIMPVHVPSRSWRQLH